MMIFAIAALSLTMAACNGKKAEQPQTATTEVAVVTDTAFQNKAAGDYQSCADTASCPNGKTRSSSSCPTT